MRIITRTNLDLTPRDRALLPELLGVPGIGHRVHIRSGLQLEVVGVVWYNDRVKIELHIPISWNISIAQWECRYRVQP